MDNDGGNRAMHRGINKPPMLSTEAKVILVAIAHICVGTRLASASHSQSGGFSASAVALLGLVFADVGLVGIWAGLSPAMLPWRLFVTLAAIVYMCIVLSVSPVRADLILRLMIAFSTVAFVTALLILRQSRYRLRLAYLPKEMPSVVGFQFSIRNLLIATAIVAIVLGIGRGVQAAHELHTQYKMFMATSLCMIVVTLSTLRAILAPKFTALRMIGVVPLACSFGMIPVFYIGQLDKTHLNMLLAYSAVFGLQAIITAASLLVVRSCGWRLVWELTAAQIDGSRGI